MVGASQVDLDLIDMELRCFSGKILRSKLYSEMGPSRDMQYPRYEESQTPLKRTGTSLPCSTQHHCPGAVLMCSAIPHNSSLKWCIKGM